MENGRAHSNQRRRQKNHSKTSGKRENGQPAQGQAHPPREGERSRPTIRIESNARLQNGRSHLEAERDQTDLDEAEMEARFEQWIDRRDERLDRVVEQVRKTDRKKNGKHSWVGCARK